MKKIPFLFMFLVIFFVLVTDCDCATWKFVSPMPHGRYGHDAILGPDGKIYVMGGMVFKVTNKSIIDKYYDGMYSNLVYDPKKDTWKYLTPVLGGVLTDKKMLYEPEKRIWKYVKRVDGKYPPGKIRNTNLIRQGDGVSIVTGKDGLIYWIGGKGASTGNGENIVLPYDPLKDEWPEVGYKRVYYSDKHMAFWDKTVYKTDIPHMLDRRMDHESVVISDGRIYVFGGWHKVKEKDSYGNMSWCGIRVLDTIECYNPLTNKWENKHPMKMKRMLFAAVTGPEDRIYVFGGGAGLITEESTPVLDTTEVYDPKADTWSYRAHMPGPRMCHAGVLGADGKFYIIGGESEIHGSPLKDVFIYDPIKDTWETGPSMNIPRGTLSVVATPDGKIYAIGGTDRGAYEKNESLNRFLPRKSKLYTGKVQDTMEELDISK